MRLFRGDDCRIELWLFLGLLGLLLVTAGGHLYSSDEETVLATALMLARGEGFALPADAEQRIVLAVAQAPDGRLYGQYPPGQALAALPLMLLARAAANLAPADAANFLLHLVMSVFNQVVVALLAVIMYMYARDLGASPRRALLIALTAALTSPLWQYSKTFFSEPLSALLVLTTAWQIRRGHYGLAGVALALAPAVKYAAILFYLPLGIYAIMRAPRAWRKWLAFIAPLAVTVAGLALFNYARFGEAMATGYHHNQDTGYSGVPWVGWLGLTVSPGRGLLWYWPPVLLALAALRSAWREAGAEMVMVVIAALLHVVFYGEWFTWAGENSWGPRYLVPVIPLLALLLVWWRPRRRELTYALAAAGLLVQVAGVGIYFNHYYAVAGTNLPELQRKMGPYYLHDFHFDPLLSPIIGHWRLLAHHAVETGLLFLSNTVPTNKPLPETTAWIHYAFGDRPVTAMDMLTIYRVPDRVTPLYSWFFMPTLDFAWCYWWYSGLPRAWSLLWLLPLLLALLAAGRLRRLTDG